jgi:valyl-tRNA synthetase
LAGKKARVPLFDFEVPIFKDEFADMEKGTGVMMVCSYGDKFDVDAINRYKLRPKIVFNYDGTLNFGNYKGIRLKEARRQILRELKEKGLILEQEQISHVVNVHDKCGTEIEFLPTKQWFIKILDKKKELIKQGKKVKWYPKHMYKRYENWVKGLEWDWSISRDRHFGISIPVWNCKNCGKTILANEKDLPVDPAQEKKFCKKCGEEAEPETKVLDTWATSSLTPQIASFLIKNKIKIPYSLRPQAHDIIRTWAFYTLVKSYFHENKLPWKDIMISGFVTLGGEKMSKSKGISIDPREIMKKYSADALRFWASGSRLGEDLDYNEKEVISGKRFITKIFNASKFVFMNLKGFSGKKPKKLEKVDILFLDLLNFLVKKATKNFEEYNYSLAKSRIENFFWKDFADNYLEIVKKRIYNEKGDKRKSAQYTLYYSLSTILKLISPIMPFVTEEIYQTYFRKSEKTKSIHLCDWPEEKVVKIKDTGEWRILTDNISKVRQEKTFAKRPMNAKVGYILLPKEDYEIIKKYEEPFLSVSGAAVFKVGKDFKLEFAK